MDTNDVDKRETLKKIRELFSEAAKYRNQFEKDWKTYEKFYDGKHWPEGSKRPVRNEIFKIIEGEVPILTDRMPGTDVLARQEGREEDAKLLQTAIHNVYEDNALHLKQSQAVRATLISAPSYFYPDFDPDAEDGEGAILIKILPWRQVYIDPSAELVDTATYAIIRIPMKIDEIVRKFPKLKDKIKPQNISFSNQGDIVDSNSREL